MTLGRFINAPQDQGVLSVWQDQVAQVAQRDLTLREQLLQRERELLPRFAKHYEQLKSLPRRVRRAMQRQWKRSLAGLALLLALGQAPTLAATIKVGGACTLVRAITAANLDTTVDGCTRGRGADEIVLPARSTRTLRTVYNSFYGPTGLPIITSAITIDGNGSTIKRRSGAPDFRIFAVARSGNLKLQETTVSGGKLTESPRSYDGGGGVLNYGRLTLTNSTISGNSASYRGGGVDNLGTAIVTNSFISGNSANTGGGGVATSGTAIVSNSTISANDAGAKGGGVLVFCCESNKLTLTNSTISGNSAGEVGGGIYATES